MAKPRDTPGVDYEIVQQKEHVSEREIRLPLGNVTGVCNEGALHVWLITRLSRLQAAADFYAHSRVLFPGLS